MSFDRVIGKLTCPEPMVPATHAMRSLLALKLFGTQRHTHVISAVLDEGLALFAGLNVIPKRSFLTEYSSRIVPGRYPRLMRHWFDAMSGLAWSTVRRSIWTFTDPFHGEYSLVRSITFPGEARRQKGILAFLAQDGDKHFFCYANSHLRKGQKQ